MSLSLTILYRHLSLVILRLHYLFPWVFLLFLFPLVPIQGSSTTGYFLEFFLNIETVAAVFPQLL